MSGDLWSQILGALEQQMTRMMFNSLLSGARGVIQDDVLYIQLPGEMTVQWVGTRLMPLVERTAERVAGRRLTVELGTRTPPASRGPPLQHASTGSEQAPPVSEAGGVPDDLGVSIELVRLNPERYGFVKLSNYAVRFWQPYLGAQPFALWIALRSFAYSAQREVWPSIQTLADICAGGNRHVLLGRAERCGRMAVTGALPSLEKEGIVNVTRRGCGTRVKYTFRVVDPLPLLTPVQADQLAGGLRTSHERFLRNSGVDLNDWRRLRAHSLLSVEMPMSGT